MIEPTKEEELDSIYGLEPVIEIGQQSGRGLEQFSDVDCPYCGERILLCADLSAGSQAYVEDCQVCCQPMMVTISVDAGGDQAGMSVERM